MFWLSIGSHQSRYWGGWFKYPPLKTMDCAAVFRRGFLGIATRALRGKEGVRVIGTIFTNHTVTSRSEAQRSVA
jgi:hypothetical protein